MADTHIYDQGEAFSNVFKPAFDKAQELQNAFENKNGQFLKLNGVDTEELGLSDEPIAEPTAPAGTAEFWQQLMDSNEAHKDAFESASRAAVDQSLSDAAYRLTKPDVEKAVSDFNRRALPGPGETVGTPLTPGVTQTTLPPNVQVTAQESSTKDKQTANNMLNALDDPQVVNLLAGPKEWDDFSNEEKAIFSRFHDFYGTEKEPKDPRKEFRKFRKQFYDKTNEEKTAEFKRQQPEEKKAARKNAPKLAELENQIAEARRAKAETKDEEAIKSLDESIESLEKKAQALAVPGFTYTLDENNNIRTINGEFIEDIPQDRLMEFWQQHPFTTKTVPDNPDEYGPILERSLYQLPGVQDFFRSYQIPEEFLKEERKQKKSDEQIIKDWSDKIVESTRPNERGISEAVPIFSNAAPGLTQEQWEKAPVQIREFFHKIYDFYLPFIEQCFFPIEGQIIDKDGNITFDENSREYSELAKYWDHYMKVMKIPKKHEWLVYHQITKRLGYAPDNHGLWLGKEEQGPIPANVVIQAILDNIDSQQKYGHPYGYVGYREFGGTQCFPIGVMTLEEAQVLTEEGAICEGQDPFELMTEVANHFNQEVRPQIRAVAQTKEDGVSQMVALDMFVRSLAAAANISPTKFGLSANIARGYETLLEETDPRLHPDADPEVLAKKREQIELKEARNARSKARLDRQRNDTEYVYDEDVVDPNTGVVLRHAGSAANKLTYIDGSKVSEIRSSKVSPFDAACNFAANEAKFVGVVGFTPIIVTGFAEHATGNLYTAEANRLLNKASELRFGNDKQEQYRTSYVLLHLMETKEAAQSMHLWKTLFRAGGQDAVALFYDNYGNKGGLTEENVRSFINDVVNKPALFQGPFAKKARELASKADNILAALLPGDIGFENADAKRWIEAFMLNQQFTSRDGDRLERSFTTAEVEEMIQAMGIERFMAAAMDTYAGRDAFLMMRDQTLGRESPITYAVDTILRRHGLTNAIVTLGIDTYFRYGINMIQNFLPFSNTISYLATRGINYVYKTRQEDFNGVESPLDITALDYQMGGHDAFLHGLAKNLTYDFVKIGNVAIFGCLLATVLMTIGFDEPDDPKLKYTWSEYKIGSKIGLGGVDENGNGKGIPIYFAWALDDIMQWSGPLAYALCAMNLDQKLGEKEEPVQLARKLFNNGCYSIVSGASLLDLFKAMTHAQETIAAYDELMADDSGLSKPENWFSWAWYTFIKGPAMRALGKMTVPNFAKDLIRDQTYDHTPFKIYDRTSTTPGKTMSVQSWEEAQDRLLAEWNPLYAIYLNRSRNGYWFDNGTTQKTGYLYNEMPIATMKDPKRASWVSEFDYHPEEIPEEDLAAYNTQKVEELIDYIDAYDGNVSQALSDGFFIPADLRIQFVLYCKQMQNMAAQIKDNELSAGVWGSERDAIWAEYNKTYNRYKNLLNDWAFNKDIVWSDEGYAKLRSDSMTYYYYKDTGAPATATAYILEGPARIEKRVEPKGNVPNSLMPITTPRLENTGYNFEVLPSWYEPGKTDLERVKATGEGAVVPYGKDADLPVNTVIFGGSPDYQITGEPEYGELRASEPTINRRGYTPFQESMLYDLPNYNGVSGQMALAASAANGGSGATTTTATPAATAAAIVDQMANKFASLQAGDSADPENAGSEIMSSGANTTSSATAAKANPTTASTIATGAAAVPAAAIATLANNGVTTKNVGDDFISMLKILAEQQEKKEETSSSNDKTSASPYGTRYSYSSYRSGSSGSSSYMPRIYSTPRSINANRAATMYSKTPGDTRINSYLRPSFETKGSREAYKRQDI